MTHSKTMSNFAKLIFVSASASAWILCRASQRIAQRESLIALAKESFKALYCLCMHDRCL